MINYELALLIAIAAFVYSNLLIQPNAMLNKTYNRLYVFFKTDERRSNGKGYHPLFMMLIHCEKCIAGQIALWSFAKKNLIGYILDPLHTAGTHILFVAFAIFCAAIIRGVYNKHIHT